MKRVLVLTVLTAAFVCGQSRAADPKGVLPAKWKELGLTDAQKKDIYTIQADYKSKIEDLESQVKKLKEEEYEKMVKVLTDDQKKRLKEIKDPIPGSGSGSGTGSSGSGSASSSGVSALGTHFVADKDNPKGVLPAKWKELGLTDVQKKDIYTIQADYKSKIEDLESQVKKLKDEEYEKMVKVLTDDQKKRLKEIKDPIPGSGSGSGSASGSASSSTSDK